MMRPMQTAPLMATFMPPPPSTGPMRTTLTAPVMEGDRQAEVEREPMDVADLVELIAETSVDGQVDRHAIFDRDRAVAQLRDTLDRLIDARVAAALARVD